MQVSVYDFRLDIKGVYMPGPGKTPTQLKILRGTLRKDRAPQNESQPDLIDGYVVCNIDVFL